MLVFPNCKINFGLNVTSKRADGFHNIETVFYHVNWCDALEVIESENEPFALSQSGLDIAGDPKDNLLYKAWQIISSQKKLPSIKVHLHKTLPMGAGLGGGSADAAFFINLLNEKFKLGYNLSERLSLASELGSDCAFFIQNKSVFATGRGNEFSAIQIDLSNYYILVVYPAVHRNTRDAYQGLTTKPANHDLLSIISKPIALWKDLLTNDFESSAFKIYPQIGALKIKLYNEGAVYASMSGSGSAVFGVFEKEPKLNFPEGYLHFIQHPANRIL